MQYLSSVAGEFLRSFRPCFTAPGYAHFEMLLLGWVLVPGRRTISRVLRFWAALGRPRHHAALYRFLTVGRWSLDELGHQLFRLLQPWSGRRPLVVVDDTLAPKQGRQLFGVGIHHDSTQSAYNRGGRRIDVLRSGHCWVTLGVWIRCPWNARRGWVIPVLFRLYRSPRRCPKAEYQKRSELAREMTAVMARWLGTEREFVVVGDGAYCCKTVLRGRPEGVDFVGPITLDAALYDTVVRPSPRGRPRRKGYRIASPRACLAQRKGWQTRQIELYGRTVTVQIWTRVCVWYGSAGPAPVRVVVVRDRHAPRDGRAYVSTNPEFEASEILQLYQRRWQLEVTFRDLKQELGFGDVRNGWWRRPAGKRDNPLRPPRNKTVPSARRAVERTAPLASLAYAWIVLWYFEHGRPERDVARAILFAPWYRHKRDVSFADMHAALRRALWSAVLRKRRLITRLSQKDVKIWEIAAMAA